ncbi:hypothetical protein [Saccharopolyspora griseoalba]|uniref:Uncharacterized protein n=1 Tax=Saccharopolyspora griseoalba TaxID=1431848 RepID=A0ABW2LLW6_9PSEU
MDTDLFLSAAELPPKPDATTGHPRPPRAPGYHKEDKPPKEQDRDRVRDQAKAPSPPAGQGPVLEWYKSSHRNAVITGFVAFVIMLVGLTLIRGGETAWMQFWFIWAVLVLASFGVYASSRATECAAGAEWLKVGKTWVLLYELTSIKARVRSNAIHLDLKDGAGREVKVSTSTLQEDRDIWDLVYNGILHSVIAGGAETNGMVHSALSVPRPAPTQ